MCHTFVADDCRFNAQIIETTARPTAAPTTDAGTVTKPPALRGTPAPTPGIHHQQAQIKSLSSHVYVASEVRLERELGSFWFTGFSLV